MGSNQITHNFRSALFSVIYRSELECPNFFEDMHGVFEKAWMKSDTIVLLGDFNCDLQGTDSKTGSEIQRKTRRLLTLFQLFGMQNFGNKPTRITLGSSRLIDLIVTTKLNLVKPQRCCTFGTFRPLPNLCNS